MICIIQMDKGTPNINPQPCGWLIANDIAGAERRALALGQIKLADWLKEHNGLLEPGKYELEAAEGHGQLFVLFSQDHPV